MSTDELEKLADQVTRAVGAIYDPSPILAALKKVQKDTWEQAAKFFQHGGR